MKKEWSAAWKASKQPRKQRKYRHHALLHTRRKFFHVHLAKELRKKYKKRQLPLRKEDKVKILVGDFKGKEGKVTRITTRRGKVYIEGIERTKKDGSKALIPIVASNLILVALGKEDKRIKKRGEKNKGAEKNSS